MKLLLPVPKTGYPHVARRDGPLVTGRFACRNPESQAAGPKPVCCRPPPGSPHVGMLLDISGERAHAQQ